MCSILKGRTKFQKRWVRKHRPLFLYWEKTFDTRGVPNHVQYFYRDEKCSIPEGNAQQQSIIILIKRKTILRERSSKIGNYLYRESGNVNRRENHTPQHLPYTREQRKAGDCTLSGVYSLNPLGLLYAEQECTLLLEQIKCILHHDALLL